MKKKDTPSIEQYLNFGSEHDNKHALDVWLDAKKSGIFADATIALKAFVELRNPLQSVFDQPSKVIPTFEQYTEGMDTPQKLFIAKKVYYYFKDTLFGEQKEDELLTGITKPLDAHIRCLERENGNVVKEERTNDLRQILKGIFRQEMERLPEYLESLEPKDRLNLLCKMMPYILPKIEAVYFKEGEPYSFP